MVYVLPQHTPIKVQIKIGSHLIVVKKAGVEVWRQRVDAAAASEYEFNPSFVTAPIVAPPPGAGTPVPTDTPARKTDFITDTPPPADATPAVVEHTPVAPMPIAPIVPAPPPPTPVPTPPMPTGPVTVAPNAVAKVSGDAPNISRLKSQNIPAVAAAKLCIDPAGGVTTVDFVTKLDKHIANDLAEQLKTWKYKPYLLNGTPIGACFVVTMRMK